MAAIADESFNLTGAGDPERLEGRRVSANLFPLLGVDPQLGRTFTPEEDQPGSNRVAVLSYGLWQRRFGGDNTIVGKTLNLNGETYTVVGVMPARFQFPSSDDELWVPIAFTAEDAANRGRHYLQVVARLRPGTSLQQAQTEMSTIAARLQQQYPESNADLGAAVTSLHEHLVGDIKPALLDSSRRGRLGPVDRVRQRRQPVARARRGATKRDRGACCAGRETLALDATISD